MTINVKTGGSFQTVKEMHVYHGGQWRAVKEGHVYDGGQWRLFTENRYYFTITPTALSIGTGYGHSSQPAGNNGGTCSPEPALIAGNRLNIAAHWSAGDEVGLSIDNHHMDGQTYFPGYEGGDRDPDVLFSDFVLTDDIGTKSYNVFDGLANDWQTTPDASRWWWRASDGIPQPVWTIGVAYECYVVLV